MEEKNTAGSPTVVENAAASSPPAKKFAKTKAKSPRSKSSRHPPVSEMVTAAIKSLQDHKGSSVQAIQKYVTSTYKVDGDKMAPFIKKYLKSAITAGAVVQTKGKGASGSFKLATSSKGSETKRRVKRSVKKAPSAVAEKKPASPKKPAAPKKAAATQKTARAAKKPSSPKKTKTGAVKKPESPKAKEVQPKNLSKAKKATKAPAAKRKTPKPKIAKSPKIVRASSRK